MTNAGKHYRDHCTGEALQTAQRHVADEDITLFAGWFCPFVQRPWVALEYLGIPYKYYEVDPYKKPKELLELSPKGLVPALKLNNYNPPRALNESTVIMDFLEECVFSLFMLPHLGIILHTHVLLPCSLASTSTKRTLFPPTSDPYARALVHLQADHINRTLIPAFYRYLRARGPVMQAVAGNEFKATIDTLVELFERADEEVGGTGLWKEGGELGWADVMVGPWMFRATILPEPHRGIKMPEGAKFNAWLKRLLEHPSFKGTCSMDEFYFESYERRAPSRFLCVCFLQTKGQLGSECDQYWEELVSILGSGE
ncbi:glutathione S-transferase [Lanmaoa asiatica]|nr:glutathione S-transferase [Lanmaoa asiatica]